MTKKSAGSLTRRQFLAATAAAGASLGFMENLEGAAVQAQAGNPGHFRVSGRYPHLTVFNRDGGGECGVGAIVKWQDRLWVITYHQHSPGGSSDKLWIINEDLNREHFPDSVGGTPANRMIHRESNQLLIGPYFVDEDRNIRVIPMGDAPDAPEEDKLFGRLTGTARHLHDPGNKVYHFDMEGLLYEVDVHTLEVNLLYARPVPGWHAKGAYTGQGRLVIGNNGEHASGTVNPFQPFEYQIDPGHQSDEDAGILADWDGEDEWRLIKRRQFTEVTGPGGIYGAPDDEAPVWATGWDKRSLILMVMENEEWREFRMPKADFSYDGHHGWHTEWPRIREAVPAANGEPPRLLMIKNGGLFDFPIRLTPGDRSGLRPISAYLKIISDVENWNGELVFACNDASPFDNPLVGQGHSNLWFSTWDALHDMGAPVGWGGVWMEDPVEGGAPSVPFFIAGYEQRVLHLGHDSGEPVTFHLEIDRTGKNDWEDHAEVEVPAEGYAHHVIPPDAPGEWMRVRADRDVSQATAHFHFGPSKGSVADEAMFAPLATVETNDAYTRGIIRPRGGDLETLHLWARHVDADGEVSGVGYYEIGEDLVLRHKPEDTDAAEYLRQNAAIEAGGMGQAPDGDLDIEIDEASVILFQGATRFRLPKGHEAYGAAWPGGDPRRVREVVTERALLNAAGTFYMMPRNSSGGVRALKPVATHNKRIIDFCSWLGMMVVTGVAADADPEHPHLIPSDDGRTGLWVGDIDDLWKLGKPRGVGGPWRGTAVEAGEASDPYLMTGYDRKRVELSHNADSAVTFALEIDIFGAIHTPETYFTYAELTVPAGETVTHEFPEGFAAHWIRLRPDANCAATAVFTYE
ncbi:MAG: twin-arginine translocation signal domain-containing protein [Candidatus Hydrogenedentota bacterium]